MLHCSKVSVVSMHVGLKDLASDCATKALNGPVKVSHESSFVCEYQQQAEVAAPFVA